MKDSGEKSGSGRGQGGDEAALEEGDYTQTTLISTPYVVREGPEKKKPPPIKTYKKNLRKTKTNIRNTTNSRTLSKTRRAWLMSFMPSAMAFLSFPISTTLRTISSRLMSAVLVVVDDAEGLVGLVLVGGAEYLLDVLRV